MHITTKCFAAAFALLFAFNACTQNSTSEKKNAQTPLQGTWRLISGTVIEKNDTTVTDYTQGKSFIKIINGTHFAFTGHDLQKGADSATAFFASGAGRYELHDSAYTEKLDYCSDRQWEGNEFHFTIAIVNDTLIQQGIEKVEGTAIDRVNIERYVRVKD